MARQVIANLDKAVADLPCRVLGLYWPIKREIDLLKWAASLSETRGIALALPVVSIPGARSNIGFGNPAHAWPAGSGTFPCPSKRNQSIPTS